MVFGILQVMHSIIVIIAKLIIIMQIGHDNQG